MSYQERLAELKAELATLKNVPCFMLRTLRVCELRCEHLSLEAQRFGVSLAARAEISVLRSLSEARFTAEATGVGAPEGPEDVSVEADAVLVVRDLQLAPLEASIALLSAEVEVLESIEFAELFDGETLGRDAAVAVRQFVTEHPDLPVSSAFAAAATALS